MGGGLALILFAAAWTILLGGEVDHLQFGLVGFSNSGGVFALLVTVVWYGGTGRQPGRLSLTIKGSLPRLRRGFRAGLVITAVSLGPVIWLAFVNIMGEDPETGFIIGEDRERSFESITFLCQMLMLCLAIGIVISLALAVHSWLDAPPARSAETGPVESVRQDRRSALVGATTAGAVVGTTGWAAWGTALFLGKLLGRTLTGWPGVPAEPDVEALASDLWAAGFGLSEFAIFGLLPGMVFGVLVLLTRAWPRFLITRAILAARGGLPWRLLAFLADARERGLLRQSGSTYQFRHIRLQEALAAVRPAGVAATSHDGRVPRRTVLAAGAVLASVGTATAVMSKLPEDQSLFGFSEHNNWVSAVAVSPDGSLVASGDVNGAVWLHRMLGDRTRSTVLQRDLSERDVYGVEIAGLALHPGGEILVVADSTGRVEVWSVSPKRRLRTLMPGHDDTNDATQTLAFSSDGRFLAYGGPGKSGLRTWDTDTWRRGGGVAGIAVRGLAFAPEDEAVMILQRSADNREKVFRFPAHMQRQITAETAPQVALPSDHNLSSSTLSFSRDGRTFAILNHNGQAGLWQTDSTGTARLSTTLGTPTGLLGSDVIRTAFSALTFSRTVSTTLVLAEGRTLRLYDTSTRQFFRTLTGHTGVIRSMALAHKGNYLVTGGKDHSVRLWDIAST